MSLRRFLAVLTLGACAACHGVAPASLTGSASDHWTRSYTINPDGEFQIVAANGTVDIRGGDGTSVDVEADRIAKASSDSAASEIVPRITIREDVTPEKVVVQTEGLGGIVIGVDVVVNYKVTMPRKVNLRVRTANGPITIADMAGRVVASSANGKITASNISGGLEVRSVNAGVAADLAAFGDDPVEIRSTNGSVDLAVPPHISASLLVNVTNGKFENDAVPFEPFGEQTVRRIRGRLNDGGSPIEVTVVNGGVRLHARP